MGDDENRCPPAFMRSALIVWRCSGGRGQLLKQHSAGGTFTLDVPRNVSDLEVSARCNKSAATLSLYGPDSNQYLVAQDTAVVTNVQRQGMWEGIGLEYSGFLGSGTAEWFRINGSLPEKTQILVQPEYNEAASNQIGTVPVTIAINYSFGPMSLDVCNDDWPVGCSSYDEKFAAGTVENWSFWANSVYGTDVASAWQSLALPVAYQGLVPWSNFQQFWEQWHDANSQAFNASWMSAAKFIDTNEDSLMDLQEFTTVYRGFNKSGLSDSTLWSWVLSFAILAVILGLIFSCAWKCAATKQKKDKTYRSLPSLEKEAASAPEPETWKDASGDINVALLEEPKFLMSPQRLPFRPLVWKLPWAQQVAQPTGKQVPKALQSPQLVRSWAPASLPRVVVSPAPLLSPYRSTSPAGSLEKGSVVSGSGLESISLSSSPISPNRQIGPSPSPVRFVSTVRGRSIQEMAETSPPGVQAPLSPLSVTMAARSPQTHSKTPKILPLPRMDRSAEDPYANT